MNKKEVAILSLIIFASVVAWVIFGINLARNKSALTQKELQQVIPLTPTFDNEIIKRLNSREE